MMNSTRTRSPRKHLAIAMLSVAFAAACGGDADDNAKRRAPGTAGVVSAPTVSATTPANKATGVPIETKLAAYFNVAMDPLGASTFTVKQGDTAVAGTVATTGDGMAATFTPSASLATDSVLTATISTGAMTTDGVAFAKSISWSFTTVTAASMDTTAPVVSSTNPAADASGVAINTNVAATFSKPLDPLTINSSTFTVTESDRQVPGKVTYGPGTIAIFTPTKTLPSDKLFTVKITGDVKDLLGNALASTVVWHFTTGNTKARGPSPVLLGTAAEYAILAKTGISTVPASVITGDIGVSPAAASYLTGFSLTADATNVFSTSPQIVGKAFAANYAVPTPSNLTTAISNMETAYTDGQGRPTPDFLELGSGDIGGKTLAPGLYKWTSTVSIPAEVTLVGGANDVWIFQTSGDLVQSASTKVILSGGAQAKNVFWLVAGFTTLEAGSHFEGILLCKTRVTVMTGASMNGRILAQTAVALQKATVTQPAR